MNKMIHFVPPLSHYKRQNKQNKKKDSFCTYSVTFQGTKWTKRFILYPLCHITKNKINKKIHFVPPLSLFKRQNKQKDSFCTPSVTFQKTKWTKWTKWFISYPLSHFTRDKMNKMNKMIHFVPLCHFTRDKMSKMNKLIHFVPPLSHYKR